MQLRHCLFHTRSRLWRPEGERRTEGDNASHSCSAEPSSTAVKIIEIQAAQTVSGIITVIPSGHLTHVAKENVLLTAHNSVVRVISVWRCLIRECFRGFELHAEISQIFVL